MCDRGGGWMVSPIPTTRRSDARSQTMKRRSYIPYLATAAVLFVAGLALGAGKSSEDTSAANTASKILLAVGLLAMIVTGVLEVLARRRSRRSSTGQAREVAGGHG